MARMAEFTAAFGIPCQAPEVVQGIYREQLGSLPADILKLAVDRVRANWSWGNRMPFPAEVLSYASVELTGRKRALARAEVAILKAVDGAEAHKNVIPKERWDELRRKLSRATKDVKMETPKIGINDVDPDLKAQWAKIADDCGL